MRNEAVAYGIIANDPLMMSDPQHAKMIAATQTAAKIFAHHIDGESRPQTIDSVLNEAGYRQSILAKAVEHELDIHQANQASTHPSGVAEMSLRIASDASFQLDSLRIHNAVSLENQNIDLGTGPNEIVAECRRQPWLAEEIRQQAHGNYSALDITAQMEISDDIATMRHMSADTQGYGWEAAQSAEKAFLQRGMEASVHPGIQMDHAVSM